MSEPPKRRRSNRSRLMVDYTKGLGDDSDGDYAGSSQADGSAAPASRARPATRRTAASAKMRNQGFKVKGDSDDDPDFAQPPKKKLKLVVVKPQKSNLSCGERIELSMKKTCQSLNIPYSTFDKWPFSRCQGQDGGPSLTTMPNEVILFIFSFSRSDDLLSLRKTCKHFRALLKCESVWRESRLKYLTPLPDDLPMPLPFGLDEINLYQLSFSKTCSHCGVVAKPQEKLRVFYNWGMRGCKDCVKQFTLSHKELMVLLSKKTDLQHTEREALISTLEWHNCSPYRSRGICWKAQAYKRLEDVEAELLSDNFYKWAKENDVPRSVERHHELLDLWRRRATNAIVCNEMAYHRLKRQQRRFVLIELCKRLPEPIPESALPFAKHFMTLYYRNTELKKSEFIEALPGLLREWAFYREEQAQVARLERTWRIQLQYFVEETAAKILADLHLVGDIDPITWRQTLITAITKAAKANPRYTMSDTCGKFKHMFEEVWKPANKPGGRELGKLNEALTQAIYSGTEFVKQVPVTDGDHAYEDGKAVLPRKIHEFFERGNDRVFTCPYRWSRRKADNDCNHTAHMALLELVEHCSAKHSVSWNDKKETTWEHIMDRLVLHPDFGGEIYCFLGHADSVFSTSFRNDFRCYPSFLRSPDMQVRIPVMVVARRSGIVGYLIDASSEQITSRTCCSKGSRSAITVDTTHKDASSADLQVAVISNAEATQKHRKASIEVFGYRSEVFSHPPTACVGLSTQHVALKGTYIRLKITYGRKPKLDTWLKSVPTLPVV